MGNLAVLRLLAIALVAAPSACSPPKQEVSAPRHELSVRPGVNAKFTSDALDVQEYVGLFEGESREIAVHSREVVAAIGLAAATDVADVGAGTGLFLAPLSQAVGAEGRVVALDIAPKFIEYMKERVAFDALANVAVRLCAADSIGLEADSIDVAFVCDTYHHFEFPVSTLASIRSALRPAGRLVIVDFERIPGTSREWVLEHVRATKEVVKSEIEAAGFVLEAEPKVEGLLENYVLIFRRARR